MSEHDHHDPDRHNHHRADAGPRRVWGLLLMLGFAAVEAGAALWSGSLALLGGGAGGRRFLLPQNTCWFIVGSCLSPCMQPESGVPTVQWLPRAEEIVGEKDLK